MPTNEHTHAKTPWKFDRHGVLISLGDRGRTIGKLFGTDPVRQVAEANAALIVRAVNRDAMFEEMLQALESLRPEKDCPFCDMSPMGTGVCGMCMELARLEGRFTSLLTRAKATE